MSSLVVQRSVPPPREALRTTWLGSGLGLRVGVRVPPPREALRTTCTAQGVGLVKVRVRIRVRVSIEG